MNDETKEEFVKYIALCNKGNIEEDSVYDFEDFEAGWKARDEKFQRLEAENKKLRELLEHLENQILCHAGSCSKCISMGKTIHKALKDGE